MNRSRSDQHDRVRERFTRTAQQFASFSLTTRAAEAERLVRLAAPGPDWVALDVACGPGTFTFALAPRVRLVYGLDLTLALLEQARAAAAKLGLTNLAFIYGEAAALPFADSVMDLATCAYSWHHFPDPAPAIQELARVVRPGGCVAVVDLIVPDDPAQAEVNNQMERARDASHTRTLAASEIRALLESAGLRIRAWETEERLRSFDDWMHIAGWKPGDPAYAQTRRRMEASTAGDRAGFHPRFVTPAAAGSPPPHGDIEFVQTSLFAVAEKH